MATGTAGSSAREVMMPVVQTLAYTLNYGATGASSGILIGKIPTNSVIQSWRVTVETAFNAGTTNPITIGTTGTGTDIMAAASITNYNTSSNTVGVYTGSPAAAGGWAITTADTSVYVAYIPTGTAASTGKAHVVINYVSMVANNAV